MYEFGFLNGCFMTLQAVAGIIVALIFFQFSDYENSYQDPDYSIGLNAAIALAATWAAISFFFLPMLYLTVASHMAVWKTVDLMSELHVHYIAYAFAYTVTVLVCIAYVRFKVANIKKLLKKKILQTKKPKLKIVARRTGTY